MKQRLQLATLLRREFLNRPFDLSKRAQGTKLSVMHYAVNSANPVVSNPIEPVGHPRFHAAGSLAPLSLNNQRSTLDYASLHHSYPGSAVPRYPPHWLQRRKQFRGGSLLVMLRPAWWLERLASPRQQLGAADRPARLRQSLPQSRSPLTGVCYHYSAQPSIAEAGLAPASMLKPEGCS